ncbi:MAG TPA: hypothetical protein VNI77_03165 [Nitrososphaera sp.]|nr:hypothetical protein [Nitrososphaera sp.]
MLTDSSSNIEIRCIRHAAGSGDHHEAMTKIIVIDKKHYLIVELNDDSKEMFVEAVRSAIHSTSRSTVMSYLALFESL